MNVGLGLFGDSVLSIQPEVLYSIKGDQATATDSSLNAQLAYLDVPVLLKANIGGLFFEAGPQFSFLYSDKFSSTSELIKVVANHPSLDYGFAFGFGYQDVDGFNVGWRYSQGLNPITKSITTIATNTTSEVKIRNSVLQFYVGYLFGDLFGHRKHK